MVSLAGWGPGVGDLGGGAGGDIGGEESPMQPVTDQAIEPEAPETPETDADEMPNFEAGTTPEPEEPEAEEPEETEESVEPAVKEDKDITDPKKADYDTTTQDLREPPKEKGAQKPKGKGKKLEGFESGGTADLGVKSAPALKPVKTGENRI